MMRFQELVSATIKQNVPLDELASHVMTLGAFDPVFKEPQVRASAIISILFQRVENCRYYSQSISSPQDYFSFFNYDLLFGKQLSLP